MLFIARWLVKLIPFSDFDYLIPLGYKNQENCKIAGKNFKIKYHVTHCKVSMYHHREETRQSECSKQPSEACHIRFSQHKVHVRLILYLMNNLCVSDHIHIGSMDNYIRDYSKALQTTCEPLGSYREKGILPMLSSTTYIMMYHAPHHSSFCYSCNQYFYKFKFIYLYTIIYKRSTIRTEFMCAQYGAKGASSPMGTGDEPDQIFFGVTHVFLIQECLDSTQGVI